MPVRTARRLVLAACALAGCALAGCEKAPAPACRAVTGGGGPSWLLLGNSLLYDHDWPELGGPVANCGLRGQTVAEAAARPFPSRRADVVLVAFGTVEAVRAASGAPFDEDRFGRDATRLLARARRAAPSACLVAATPPPADPMKADADVLARAGAATRSLPGVIVLDSRAALGPDWTATTYDGVHLTSEAYAAWGTAAAEAAARCRGRG